MGRDRPLCVSGVPVVVVSIHAPVEGATLHDAPAPNPFGCFNPRARRGRDRLILASPARCGGFNPRARRGRDLSLTIATAWCSRFKPRARIGRDRRYHRLPAQHGYFGLQREPTLQDSLPACRHTGTRHSPQFQTANTSANLPAKIGALGVRADHQLTTCAR